VLSSTAKADSQTLLLYAAQKEEFKGGVKLRVPGVAVGRASAYSEKLISRDGVGLYMTG